MLVPPANFGIAEMGIYRCSKLETLNLSFVETLNLKTIVFIGGQEPSHFFKEFFARSSIDWHVFRMTDLATINTPVLLESNSSNKNNDNETNLNDNVDQRISNDNLDDPISNTFKNNDTKRNLMQPSFNNIQNTNNNNNNNDFTKGNKLHDKTSSDNDNSSPHCGKYTSSNNNLELKKEKNSDLINLNLDTDSSFELNDSDELMLIKSTCLKKTFCKLLNNKYHNILLVDKTALVIGILRKIQKWNIASIINEYRLFSGKNSSYIAETFLEMINIKIKQKHINKNPISDELHDTDLYDDWGNYNSSYGLSSISDSDKLIYNRKLSNFKFVQEDDLLLPPEVPNRLLHMIDEAEKMKLLNEFNEDNGISNDGSRHHSNNVNNEINNNKTSFNNRNELPLKMTRTESDLGFFVHKYRLAFDKKDSGNFMFYKPNSEKNYITIDIPRDSKLPEWFKYQRDLWENDNVPDVHHFYKEKIFI